MQKNKKKGVQAYESGKQLENRVAKWLTKQGYTCWKSINARGKTESRPYDVDVYATKGKVYKHHIWVECKAYKVKRSHIFKLVGSAKDVKDLYEQHPEVQKWASNMLMLVSNKGFDEDALRLASKHRIYCVIAGRTFQFIGRMSREGMKDVRHQNSNLSNW